MLISCYGVNCSLQREFDMLNIEVKYLSCLASVDVINH